MGIISDTLDKHLEDEMEELLKPFVQEDDFVFDSWRGEKVFDYKKCIKRVVAELSELKKKYQSVSENKEEHTPDCGWWKDWHSCNCGKFDIKE